MYGIIDLSAMSAVGDAVREKAGTTGAIAVSDLAQAITDLPTGGGNDIGEFFGDFGYSKFTCNDGNRIESCARVISSYLTNGCDLTVCSTPTFSSCTSSITAIKHYTIKSVDTIDCSQPIDPLIIDLPDTTNLLNLFLYSYNTRFFGICSAIFAPKLENLGSISGYDNRIMYFYTCKSCSGATSTMTNFYKYFYVPSEIKTAYYSKNTNVLSAPQEFFDGDFAMRKSKNIDLSYSTIPNNYFTCTDIETISAPNVTAIGSNAFAYCNSLTTVSFPSTTTVNYGAFLNCKNLSDVNIPLVKTISSDAFAKTGIVNADFPLVSTLYSNTFNNCKNLETVNMPLLSKISGEYCFANCTNLTSVVLSTSISAFVNNTFYNCKNLKSIPNADNIKYIGQNAFNGTGIENITLPLCTSIYSYTFNSCNNVTSISVPLLNSCGVGVFRYCYNLETAYLPNLSVVSGDMFFGCKNLTSVTFSDTAVINGGAFCGCEKLPYIDMPNNTSIGIATFSGCYNLSSVSIPKVTSIADYAFYSCSNLGSISMPNVSYIGTRAFLSCCNLESVYIGTSNCRLYSTDAFSYTPMSVSTYLGHFGSIFVQSSYYDFYTSTSTYWKTFSSRIVSCNEDWTPVTA